MVCGPGYDRVSSAGFANGREIEGAAGAEVTMLSI